MTSIISLHVQPQWSLPCVFFYIQQSAPTIHLFVVNWGGEEVARVEVLPLDKVLVGQIQIEEQIGVPPHQQRLVHGEQQLEEAEPWSTYGVRNWSTVQLTVINDVCVYFSAFAPPYPSSFFAINPPPPRARNHILILFAPIVDLFAHVPTPRCHPIAGFAQYVRSRGVGSPSQGKRGHN